MTDTIQSLAAELAAHLVDDTRADGSPFVRLADDRRDWMESAVCAAHGDMGPDDWRYSAIRQMANDIADVDDDADVDDFSDAANEAIDSAVDVNNGRLIVWLASHLARISYCDDAAEELGIGPDAGVIRRLQLGQYAEYCEIWDSLVAVLRQEIQIRADGETSA